MKSRLDRDEGREVRKAAAIIEELQGLWPGILVRGVEVGPAQIAAILLDWVDGGERWAADVTETDAAESPPASVFEGGAA